MSFGKKSESKKRRLLAVLGVGLAAVGVVASGLLSRALNPAAPPADGQPDTDDIAGLTDDVTTGRPAEGDVRQSEHRPS